MKTRKLTLLLVSISVLTLARSAEVPNLPVAPPAVTTVNVATTATELATGYAAAVQQMSLKGLVLYFRGDKDVVALKGIRAVRALNGVLLITFSGGDMAAISAEKIVLITDGARTP